MICSLISLKNEGREADRRFPIIFYYRIANQLIHQVRNSGLTELRDPRYMISHFPQKIHPLQGTPIQNFKEKSGMASIYSVDSRTSCSPLEFHCATIKTASKCQRIIVHTVTLSSPSPVLSCVESLPQGAHVSHIPVADSEHGHSKSYTEASTSQVLRDVHISTRLMEEFLELAKENTDKDLETCGILGAFLERGTFYVTTLIIPKQESTSSSCQAINEEEVFAIQNERSLLPLGWIHTHPSQSCFMSSVDLHTQYSYQVMVPEAFAIVMAPTDTSRSYGIFRVSDSGGMSVLKECQENDGFHPHKEVADGSPIYEQCSYVYKNSNLRFEIFDLR